MALSVSTRQRLMIFSELLIRWNSTIGLVSSQDTGQIWARHVEDALQLIPFMPPKLTNAIDLGSGGGFPGLVLAIATGVRFDLIESDHRKTAFLREAVSATQAPATIHTGRIEGMALHPRLLVTARALAPLPALLELAQPLLAEGGRCLFPKGERVDAEIALALNDWAMDLEQMPSHTSSTGRILSISNLRRQLRVAL